MPKIFDAATPFPDVQTIFDSLDDYLAYRYVDLQYKERYLPFNILIRLVGHTLQDPALVSETVKYGVPSDVSCPCRNLHMVSLSLTHFDTANSSAIGSTKKPGRPHLTRWYNHVESLPIPKAALESINKAKNDLEKSKKVKRMETVEVVLPNAVPGKVVVRFGESGSCSAVMSACEWGK